MSNRYAVIPYDRSKPHFYVTSPERLAAEVERHGVEEYEIELLTGHNLDAGVFEAATKRYGSLAAFLLVEGEDPFGQYILIDNDLPKKALLIHLIEVHGSAANLEDLLEVAERAVILEGDLVDAALYDTDVSDLSEAEVALYFDWEAYARDKALNGHYVELDVGLNGYVWFKD